MVQNSTYSNCTYGSWSWSWSWSIGHVPRGAPTIQQTPTIQHDGFGSPQNCRMKPGYVVDPYSIFAIFVRNLPPDTSAQSISAVFGMFGTIHMDGIKIDWTKSAGGWSAFATVKYLNIDYAQNAIKHGYVNVDGNMVKVFPNLIKDLINNPDPVIHPQIIWSLWPCNSLTEKLIHPENKAFLQEGLIEQVKQLCDEELRGDDGFWRKMRNDTPVRNTLIHMCKAHNIYEGHIFRDDYFDLAKDLASHYFPVIPKLIEDYKREMDTKMVLRPSRSWIFCSCSPTRRKKYSRGI